MKLIDQLIARAAAADAAMGKLAAEGTNNERRKQAYAALERELSRMMSDGVLDQKEMGELMRSFRANGLDTSSLERLAKEMRETDGVVGVAVDSDVRAQLMDELRDARADLHDPAFVFKAQQLTQEYQQTFDLASRVQKAEHEIYMAAIRNLRG